MVCAAGAWSAGVGEMAGVSLPVTPVRRQILYTEPIQNLPEHAPMTIDFSTGFYFHREGEGLLMGMADPNETPGFELDASDDWIPALLEVAERRAPVIAEAGIAGGWAGLYEVSPDHNAIVGEAGVPARFLYATGSRATASCRARRSARSCATCIWAADRSWTSHRSRPTGSTAATCAARGTSCDRDDRCRRLRRRLSMLAAIDALEAALSAARRRPRPGARWSRSARATAGDAGDRGEGTAGVSWRRFSPTTPAEVYRLCMGCTCSFAQAPSNRRR